MGDQLKRVYVAGNGKTYHFSYRERNRGLALDDDCPTASKIIRGRLPYREMTEEVSGLCPGIRGGQGGRMRPNGGGADRCCVVFCGYSVGVIGGGKGGFEGGLSMKRQKCRNPECVGRNLLEVDDRDFIKLDLAPVGYCPECGEKFPPIVTALKCTNEKCIHTDLVEEGEVIPENCSWCGAKMEIDVKYMENIKDDLRPYCLRINLIANNAPSRAFSFSISSTTDSTIRNVRSKLETRICVGVFLSTGVHSFVHMITKVTVNIVYKR